MIEVKVTVVTVIVVIATVVIVIEVIVIVVIHCSYICENLKSRQRVLNLLQMFTFPAYESSP